MEIETKKIEIDFCGRKIIAHKLTISSKIPINIETAWNELITSALLEFVVKGKLRFVPVNGKFPKIWKQGSIVKTKMLLYGFIPFGGIHYLKFVKIDNLNKVLKTEEKDSFAKIWNHKISLESIEDNLISYKDEIVIYGGVFTILVSFWAKSFYKHRQKRWLLIAGKHKTTANYI